MLRIFRMELKKLLLTRAVLIGLIFSLIITIGSVLLVISYESIWYYDETGQSAEVTGMEAIRIKNELYEGAAVEMTPEQIKADLAVYQEIVPQYGETAFEVPGDVYYDKLYISDSNLVSLFDLFQSADTGYYMSVHVQPSQEEIDNYYDLWKEYIAARTENFYPGNEAAQKTAAGLIDQIDTPFISGGGIGTNAIDYLMFIQWFLMLIGIVIVAPLFSSDYQSGADDIQRCTRYGRLKYSVVKAAAGLLIVSVMYLVCTIGYTVLINMAYGFNGLDVSHQMFTGVNSLSPYTPGETQIFLIAAGFVCILGMYAFVLFLSSKSSSSSTTLIVSFGLVMLPMLLNMALDGSVIEWLINILPSSGLAVTTGLWAQMGYGIAILTAGSSGFWAPYVMVAAGAVWIPVSLAGMAYSYCRYEKRA